MSKSQEVDPQSYKLNISEQTARRHSVCWEPEGRGGRMGEESEISQLPSRNKQIGLISQPLNHSCAPA